MPAYPVSSAWSALGGGYAVNGITYIDSDNQPAVDIENFSYDPTLKRMYLNQARTAPAPLESFGAKLNSHGIFFSWMYNSELSSTDASLRPGIAFAAPRGSSSGLAVNASGDRLMSISASALLVDANTWTTVGRMFFDVAGGTVGSEGGKWILEVKQNASSNFDSLSFDGTALYPSTNGLLQLGKAGNAWSRLYMNVSFAGAAGNVTLNTSSGRVIFAAAAQTLTLTNSYITPNSNVMCTVLTDDGTAKSCIATPGSGSAVLKLNAAATGQTTVMFLVVSSDV